MTEKPLTQAQKEKDIIIAHLADRKMKPWTWLFYGDYGTIQKVFAGR